MPTYEYKCKDCGIVFERFQHFSEQPVTTCPECGASVQRVIQPVGIIFKGKGFYVTDHRSSGSSTATPGMKKTEEKGGGAVDDIKTADSAKTEAKSEAGVDSD